MIVAQNASNKDIKNIYTEYNSSNKQIKEVYDEYNAGSHKIIYSAEKQLIINGEFTDGNSFISPYIGGSGSDKYPEVDPTVPDTMKLEWGNNSTLSGYDHYQYWRTLDPIDMSSYNTMIIRCKGASWSTTTTTEFAQFHTVNCIIIAGVCTDYNQNPDRIKFTPKSTYDLNKGVSTYGIKGKDWILEDYTLDISDVNTAYIRIGATDTKSHGHKIYIQNILLK